MSGAFEQYRKSGALATLSHRNMLENCYSLHFIGMNLEKMHDPTAVLPGDIEAAFTASMPTD
jgi:hypothetical protein